MGIGIDKTTAKQTPDNIRVHYYRMAKQIMMSLEIALYEAKLL